MHIKSNVVLITGGASGLGGAAAEMIVENGGKVLIADVQQELGEAMVAKLGKANASFVKCDVTSEADGLAAVAAAVAMGQLVGCVNCAGIGPAAKTVGKDGPHRLDTFSKVITVNLIGTFNMLRLAATAMCKNTPNDEGERGVIVNTASVAAYDGQIGQAAYAASKGGIVGMTLPIARDLSRDGIRVMTIAPGLFLTPLLAGMPQEVQDSLGKQVPFPSRLGKPHEYAIMVKHIFTNTMLNGETIRLDGAIRMAPR
jgi:NAD(P)-dependent dehydrogenase (short-subunit alcohol dehydrogenase family)